MLERVVAEYYRKILFMFVPNICNAECEFCYVQPARANDARLSQQCLNRGRRFLDVAWKVGFRTLRITGGEPLLFSNLSELALYGSRLGFDYELLTNLMLLDKHQAWLSANPPKKVTVSVHSLKNYNNVFGVDSSSDEVVERLAWVSDVSAKVVVTVLLLPTNRGEIDTLLKGLSEHVDEFKIVVPNVPNSQKEPQWRLRMLAERGESYVQREDEGTSVPVRVTDIHEESCLLSKRGFLSVTLPELEVFSCCTKVGDEDGSRLGESFDARELEEILFRFQNRGQGFDTFPCKAYGNFCPIALRRKELPVER